MKNEGLKESWFDPSQIKDKMFHIYKKIQLFPGSDKLHYHWSAVYNKPWNRHVKDMFKLINKAEVLEKAYDKKPALLLSLENEFLTWSMYEKFEQFYKGGSLPMPKRHFYYRFIRHYRRKNESQLDFIYYTIPIEPVTFQYHFPSEYVGQYGVYQTIRELYKRDPNSKDLIGKESIFVKQRSQHIYTERIIDKVRHEFREKNNIPEDGIMIFVNPGNELREAKFCLDECQRALAEFKRKYFSPTSMEPRALPYDHLVTYLPIQSGCMIL